MAEDPPDCVGRDLILAEALAHVPGYAPDCLPGDPSLEIRRLPGGSVNRSYGVVTGEGQYVVRLSPGTDSWLATDRSVERELHAAAAAAGIAPRIVHADERDRWLITEYVEGRLWGEADFADAGCLARMGEMLRRLHAVPLPAHGCGRVDLLGALRGYVGRIETGDAGAAAGAGAGALAAGALAASAGGARDRDGGGAGSGGVGATGAVDGAGPGGVGGSLREYLAEAEVAWRASGAEGRAAAILHHDLNGANVIEGARGIVLIDWECAAVSDPLLDVACILSYYPGAWPHAGVLLEHSGLARSRSARAGLALGGKARSGRDAGVSFAQLAAAVWLFDLHTMLWYRERRQRLIASAAELEAEGRLSVRVARGVSGALEDAGNGVS